MYYSIVSAKLSCLWALRSSRYQWLYLNSCLTCFTCLAHLHGWCRKWFTCYYTFICPRASLDQGTLLALYILCFLCALSSVRISNTSRALLLSPHCVTSVQIRSYFWSIFSCIWTEYGDLHSKFFTQCLFYLPNDPLQFFV